MGSINYTSVTGEQFSINVDDEWVSVVDDLDRLESNSDHNYHRQDRKNVRFCSWDAYNEHGNQPAGTAVSAEDLCIVHETDAEYDAVARLLREAIDALPPAWRELLVQIFVDGIQQADIAAARGVSKPAITKQKTKALAALRSALEELGVNAEVVRGLLADQAHGLVQEGEIR